MWATHLKEDLGAKGRTINRKVSALRSIFARQPDQAPFKDPFLRLIRKSERLPPIIMIFDEILCENVWNPNQIFLPLPNKLIQAYHGDQNHRTKDG